METENVKNNPVRNNNLIILVIIICLLVTYYTIMSIISPARKLSEIERDIGDRQAENWAIDENIFHDSTYIKLLTDRALLMSRIAMAGTDSNYLTINLNDSTANIEISGVVVHMSKISRIQISKLLIKGNENIIQSMLSSPLRITKDYSTIKKEPLMIKIAPKDTSEYKPDIMPDTSITEPVSFVLELANGIRFYLSQEEDEKFSDVISLFIFDIKDRFRYLWRSLKSIIFLKVPEYQPLIKIRIPRADAKIIYRAIPQNGLVGISI